MIHENSSTQRYWYNPSEGFESRSQRRLQEDLGIDQDSAETILHLRNQVIELQARIRLLEAELTDHVTSQSMRLAHYREVYYESSWIEVEFDEG